MTIFIAADHRGFDLKKKLINWLKSEKYQVVDCGNTVFDPEDDYPDFASRLAKALLKEKSTKALGIVICGSGVGVSVAVNRFKGIRCALGFDQDQIKHARQNDHINVLALAADYFDFEKAKNFVKTFLTTKPISKEKYLRRIRKLEIRN